MKSKMKTSPSHTLPLLLALSLLSAARAQTGTVVVNGAKARAGDSHSVNAAKDRILNGRSASSCAFMDPHNPAYDPVTVAYMSDFGLDDAMSNDVPRRSDLAPLGDVSDATTVRTIVAGDSTQVGRPVTTGCSAADWRFAAGRNRIARNDRSLALGYEAYDNHDYARALDAFTTAWNKIGYDAAALMLARLHLYGLGTPKDGARAVAWLERIDTKPYGPADRMRFDPAQPTAMTPRVEAAFMLARMYERGMGVARDAARARTWSKRPPAMASCPPSTCWANGRSPARTASATPQGSGPAEGGGRRRLPARPVPPGARLLCRGRGRATCAWPARTSRRRRARASRPRCSPRAGCSTRAKA